MLQLDDMLRRVIDIALTLLGMIALSPLFLLVSIAIKRSSPGPVFYWGARAGKDGKIFKILKFRTMYERKESYEGPKVTPEDDPRITPLGRILRQTKINELPQLWNVFIGDMSLVARAQKTQPSPRIGRAVRDEILSVRPGITSPASVVYRNEEDLLQSSNLMDTYLWDILPSKLRLDQIYVRNRSILSDLDVIFWTFIALIPRLRSFSVPEHLLYWGPFSQFTSRYLFWFIVDFVIAFLAVGSAVCSAA
jgi:lipopolysaccharide/colanic/teichoic acid biosynthesis glycosyltransferase